MKHGRKFISFILVLTIIISIFAPAALAAGGGRLVVSDAEGKAGDRVEVTISLKNNPGIIAATMEVSYDAAKLRLVNVKDEGLLAESIFSDSYSRNPYYLNWNDALATVNNTAVGVIATLTFEILSGAASGKTEIVLSLSDREIFDADLNDVPFSAENGYITISGEDSGNSCGGSSGGGGGGGGGGASDSEDEPSTDDETVTGDKTEAKVSGAELYAGYTDLEADGWYREYIEFMLEMGYMDGVSETSFQPNGTITRAQLVTILHRIEGSPDVSASPAPFKDIDTASWYGTAVLWAAGRGLVNGVSDDEFAPHNAITREQLAAVLWRYNGSAAEDSSNLDSFKDSGSVSSYASSAVNWAVGAGIINGVADDVLAPAGTATRAQTAAMLYRYIKEFTAIPVPGVSDK